MAAKLVEIVCTACGADTLIKREPKYEGFKKVGERFLCTACGHEYASEAEVPFKQQKKLAVFTDADKMKKVDVFRGDEKGKTCRYCAHYTVNPFTQRCGLTNKIVQATDSCGKFEKKPDAQPKKKEDGGQTTEGGTK
jgi:hypothetical protein